MVGTSGSGKTVFAAGVYAKLMKRTFEKFRIIPRGKDYSQELIALHRFAIDYKSLAEKQWPPGTTETKYFELDLIYNGKSIAYFDWIDYRGGFLDDPTLDPDKASEVHANIVASDAVILFADAEAICKYEDINEATYRSGAEAIIALLDAYSINYPDNNLTFLIALTKADAIGSEWHGENHSFSPLIERGLQIFEPLIESTLQREKKWRGGILPVSTLGLGNVDRNGKITGFINPFNIEHVIMYCLGSILRLHQENLLDSIIREDETIEEIKEKYKGFWGVMKKTYQQLRGTYSDGDILNEMKKEREQDRKELKKIHHAIEPLERIALRKIRIISNG